VSRCAGPDAIGVAPLDMSFGIEANLHGAPPNSELQTDGRRHSKMEGHRSWHRAVIVCGRHGAAVSLAGCSTRRPQLNSWYVDGLRRCQSWS